jgi:hypothetical protein
MKKLVLAAIAAAVLGSAGSANATTIFTASTLDGCGNCFGLTYTLTVGDAGDADDTTFDASLNITGTLTGAPAAVTTLTSVSFKVADEVIPPLVLTSAPTSLSDWTTSENNITNADCAGGGAGFVCSETTTPVSLTGGALDLTWEWTFNLESGTTPEPLHIGAKLNNATGTLSGKIVSEHTFNVPDGGMTLSLLGIALAGMGVARRRMR